MLQSIRCILGVLIAALLIGAPISYSYYSQANIRNFHVVREGVLYRSGQMSLSGLKRTIHDYGIKTVVTLRDSNDPAEPPPDWEEQRYCEKEGIHYHRISPHRWWAEDGPSPAEKGVRTFQEIMDDPKNYPVLVHCFAGVHRTGAYCAIYRMEYEKRPNTEAIAELRAGGYRNLDDEWDILGFLEDYQPRWKTAPKEGVTFSTSRKPR